MGTVKIVVGVAVGGLVLWALVRATHAAVIGVHPVYAVLNPRAPLIPPQRQQAKSGAAHF